MDFIQLAKQWYVREHAWKLNQAGELFDMSKAPFEEPLVAADTKNPAAMAARKRLQAALDKLNPAGGIVDDGDGIGRHAKKAEKKKEPTPPLLKKADELKASDAMDTRLTKSPCKTYPISLTEGKIYQIDLSSKFFDAFLRLEDAKGKPVAFNNDADSSTFDARIVYKAAQTGDHKIIAANMADKIFFGTCR